MKDRKEWSSWGEREKEEGEDTREGQGWYEEKNYAEDKEKWKRYIREEERDGEDKREELCKNYIEIGADSEGR
jgi:hypothetical protein